MKRQLIIPALFLALLLSGCATMQPPPAQTDYPWLEAGIDITILQTRLQNEFDELKMFVDDETKAKLDQKIKPLILESQLIVHRYNRAVILDLPTEYTETEIRLMIRGIGRKMMEVLNVNQS